MHLGNVAALFFACCAAAAAAAAAPDATVAVSATVTGAAADGFSWTGVNMDFWPATKAKWGEAGALNLDLANPRLRTLARGLRGALLRLGGSPADFLLYGVDADACSPANLNRTQPQPGQKYFCPIWDQTAGQCLTLPRWQALLEFAADAGLALVLDLNACWGRASPEGDMDWSQIDGLLAATAAASWGASLWGVEFGNEVYDNIAPGRYGASMLRLRGELDRLWPAPAAAPRVLGPDAWEADLSPAYYRAMLNASAQGAAAGGSPNAMHAVTFHDYADDCCAPTSGNVLNVTCLDALFGAAGWVRDLASEYGVRVWNGEGALHAYSGEAGLTDTATSTLYYLHALGSYASGGFGLFSRQTLVGGDYELVNRTTFLPTPDYFGLLLWRQVVGARALAAAASGGGGALRAHAFCAASGGLAVLLVNFAAAAPLSVALQWPAGSGGGGGGAQQQQLYLLTGVPGYSDAEGASAPAFRLALNGEVLALGADGQLPALAPVALPPGAPVALPPASAAFVVLPGAQAVCA